MLNYIHGEHEGILAFINDAWNICHRDGCISENSPATNKRNIMILLNLKFFVLFTMHRKVQASLITHHFIFTKIELLNSLFATSVIDLYKIE